MIIMTALGQTVRSLLVTTARQGRRTVAGSDETTQAHAGLDAKLGHHEKKLGGHYSPRMSFHIQGMYRVPVSVEYIGWKKFCSMSLPHARAV